MMIEKTPAIELLNREYIKKYPADFALKEGLFSLPEKIIQFGTGILLRGLVDYLVDKANKNDCFNGRVVVVKSTGNAIDEFTAQDNLYTVLEKGRFNEEPYEQTSVIACLSRVLPAQQQWQKILQCAADASIAIAVSNTTEAGLVFEPENVTGEMPKSFPAKLTAYLWQRYKVFNGAADMGMIILPTELVSNNGEALKTFILKHAANNNFPEAFSNWINYNNHFCNTLVDRIVPGKTERDDLVYRNDSLSYRDHLHTTVEPYLLWAIEGNDFVKEKLSFINCDNRAVVTESIEAFKEQKLRILNGSNTTVVGVAYLAGLNTVYDTVTDKTFAAFTQQLIETEILPTIIENCPAATAFARDVMERFGNPFIKYPLLNVALQYSAKMNSRNAATIIRYHKMFEAFPPLLSIGLASFFLFYTPAAQEEGQYYGTREGEKYYYRDEHTQFLCSTLLKTDWQNPAVAEKEVATILNNATIFSPSLGALPGISEMIAKLCGDLLRKGIRTIIEENLKTAK